MRKLLLIEDSRADAAAVTDAVRRQVAEEVQIDVVQSLAQGQAAILTDDYSCVLLDLGLPDAVGTDAVAVLRCLRPDLPVIVVTGHSSAETATTALRLGAEDYINKTDLLFRPGPLGHSVRTAIERRRVTGTRAARGEGGPEGPGTADRPGLTRTAPVLAAVRLLGISADPAVLALLPSRILDLDDDRGEASDTICETLPDLQTLAQRTRIVPQPDCVVLDLTGSGTGLQDVEHAHRLLPLSSLVVLTDDDRDQFSLMALELGADDVLPVAQVDEVLLRRTIRHTLHRRRQALQLLLEAQRDVLTGLPGRTTLLLELRQAMQRLETGATISVTVVFLDLDGFKAVNDQLGHAAGDLALRIIAGRLSTAVRHEDIAARLGGDEFVILAEGLSDDEARALGARVRDLLSEPIKLDEQYSTILHASHGIVRTETRRPAESVLAEADRLMYEQKRERYRDAPV